MKVKLTYIHKDTEIVLTHRVLTFSMAKSTGEQFRIAVQACPDEYDSFWQEKKAEYDRDCKLLESRLSTPVTYENWPFKTFSLSALDKADFVHKVAPSITDDRLFSSVHPNEAFVPPHTFSIANERNGVYITESVDAPVFVLTKVEVVNES